MATRRGVGHLDARLLMLQQLCAEGVVQIRARLGEHNEADLGTKMVDLSRMTSLLKGTPLRLLRAVAEAAKDCRVSIWNVRNIHVRDEWLVLDLCGNGHCDPDGVVRRTVRESHWTGEVGRRRPTRMLHNYVQKKMSSGMMRRYPDPDSAWDLIACDADLWNCGHEISKNRLEAARSILSV